ncbi:MAG TPA: hypothetical protein VNM50_04160 [Chloroflexota bacterium]|nr:hypothetical protein [Chloroflexota bacterium]
MRDVAALDALLERIKRFGRTRTSILLASPVALKPVLPARALDPAPRAAPGPRRRRDGRAL